MGDTKYGTFDQLLEVAPTRVRPIVVQLRKLVFDVHADAIEVVRLGDRAATYGVGPRKMIDGYAYILPYDRWVNLGFYQGASLPDPEGLLEGTGARMRHVKIRSIEEAGVPGLRRLLEEALKERRNELGIS